MTKLVVDDVKCKVTPLAGVVVLEQVAQLAIDNLLIALKRKPPPNMVNPNAWTKTQ
ncbi:hypothetical protein [Halomonas sp. AOP25-F1-15]|uniref:hypothetical protein n=1 Tax=Halomonas sp. AOP25-F1-15 TaxID=3457709 RepID=UPI00403361F2